jgi:hypothetical protein
VDFGLVGPSETARLELKGEESHWRELLLCENSPKGPLVEMVGGSAGGTESGKDQQESTVR